LDNNIAVWEDVRGFHAMCGEQTDRWRIAISGAYLQTSEADPSSRDRNFENI